ncbi:unnamed protein product [Bursaphelenchus xylophilus]|nr:unnamed protein product [Bursaphelenchus xylophilus]CAG9095762.1 unnamed protein product [Bursaphelenchus xylophilus]
MDSDHSDNESNSYLEDDSIDMNDENHGGENGNLDRLPLIPTDFTDIHEAIQNFSAVFDARYGGLHPRFYSGTLRDAIDESFGISRRAPAIERKPFALYLHNDDAVAANIFAQNVLCSETASAILGCQYTLWAWDVTQDDNRKKFNDWVAELGLTDVADVLRIHPKEDYPLLLLITKERSNYSVANVCQGFDNATDCVEKIMQALDQYQAIKNKEEVEERGRLEREQIRQEQVTAYEESKAIDKARQQEQERKKQEEIAEQQRFYEEEERKLQKMAQLSSSLPAEPSGNDCITIRFRFPSGEQKIRRFNKDDKLKWLSTYVESLGYDMETHRIWNSDFPKKEISSFDATKTFAELKWPLREQVTVEEK